MVLCRVSVLAVLFDLGFGALRLSGLWFRGWRVGSDEGAAQNTHAVISVMFPLNPKP